MSIFCPLTLYSAPNIRNSTTSTKRTRTMRSWRIRNGKWRERNYEKILFYGYTAHASRMASNARDQVYVSCATNVTLNSTRIIKIRFRQQETATGQFCFLPKTILIFSMILFEVTIYVRKRFRTPLYWTWLVDVHFEYRCPFNDRMPSTESFWWPHSLNWSTSRTKTRNNTKHRYNYLLLRLFILFTVKISGGQLELFFQYIVWRSIVNCMWHWIRTRSFTKKKKKNVLVRNDLVYLVAVTGINSLFHFAVNNVHTHTQEESA